MTQNGNLMTGCLPLLAAGLSYYNKNTEGLTELFKSEANTVAAAQLLIFTVRENHPDGFDNKKNSFCSYSFNIILGSLHENEGRYGVRLTRLYGN